MSLMDDYFELRDSLKGRDRRTLRRIWEALAEAETEAAEARECVALVDGLRKLVSGQPPLVINRVLSAKKRKVIHGRKPAGRRPARRS